MITSYIITQNTDFKDYIIFTTRHDLRKVQMLLKTVQILIYKRT